MTDFSPSRFSLQELLIAHLIPGLVAVLGLFILFDQILGCQLISSLVFPKDTPSYLSTLLIAVVSALIVGPIIDALRHMLVEPCAPRLLKWLSRPIPTLGRKEGENTQITRIMKTMSEGMTGMELLALWQYYRVSFYYWGEFYGNTGLVLALVSILAGLYYSWIFFIGSFAGLVLFVFYLPVSRDCQEAFREVFEKRHSSNG